MLLPKALLAALLLVVVGLGTAEAAPRDRVLRIAGDHGGNINDYYWRYRRLAERGYRFQIDGPCSSACTFVLAYAPAGRVCVSERAVLGFHNAYFPLVPFLPGLGPSVQAPGEITQWMMAQYPPGVQEWVKAHGGLGRDMIYLRGQALYEHVPACARVRR